MEKPTWVRKYREDWVELQLAHSERRAAYNAAKYVEPKRRVMQD